MPSCQRWDIARIAFHQSYIGLSCMWVLPQFPHQVIYRQCSIFLCRVFTQTTWKSNCESTPIQTNCLLFRANVQINCYFCRMRLTEALDLLTREPSKLKQLGHKDSFYTHINYDEVMELRKKLRLYKKT